MAENIGGELNLVNWRSRVESPNFKSPNLLHDIKNCMAAQA